MPIAPLACPPLACPPLWPVLAWRGGTRPRRRLPRRARAPCRRRGRGGTGARG